MQNWLSQPVLSCYHNANVTMSKFFIITFLRYTYIPELDLVETKSLSLSKTGMLI
jgi:hypothetical protein